MGTQHGATAVVTDEATVAQRQAIRRRGLVAGAAALVAAVAVKGTSEPVAALSLQPFLLGIVNDADLILNLITTSGIIGTLNGGAMFTVTNRSSAQGTAIGAQANGGGNGVQGASDSGTGVVGLSTTGNGVVGISNTPAWVCMASITAVQARSGWLAPRRAPPDSASLASQAWLALWALLGAPRMAQSRASSPAP